MTNESVAKRLVELVGGKENIKAVENCMTRCRLELVDPT
ncbi:MAG: PTS transporter subunit EIIB, partial [Clostridium sp.]|nr:PTS transporter subunit EIIB [Clostridium sp.]MBQ8999548.1 PTS transporter subunit EIIB [Clostridium sp.]